MDQQFSKHNSTLFIQLHQIHDKLQHEMEVLKHLLDPLTQVTS